MGFLITKLPIVGFALAALFGFACVNLFLENSKLKSENSVLLKDLESAKEKNERLTKDYTTAKNNLNACNVSLSLQNEAIKAAAVKIDDTVSKEAERIKKIYVKDKSCKAELAAYKELFRD
nr:MAG TPA: cell division protein [Caudoviricetes sp.]